MLQSEHTYISWTNIILSQPHVHSHMLLRCTEACRWIFLFFYLFEVAAITPLALTCLPHPFLSNNMTTFSIYRDYIHSKVYWDAAHDKVCMQLNWLLSLAPGIHTQKCCTPSKAHTFWLAEEASNKGKKGTHEKSYKTFNNTLRFPTNTSVAQLHTFQSRSRLPPGKYMQVYNNTPGNTSSTCQEALWRQNWQSFERWRLRMHQKACIMVCAVGAKCSFGWQKAAVRLALHKVGNGLKDESHSHRTRSNANTVTTSAAHQHGCLKQTTQVRF